MLTTLTLLGIGVACGVACGLVIVAACWAACKLLDAVAGE